MTTVGKVARWDIIPHRARTPPTLDVAAAFADTDTEATSGFLAVRGTIDGYGAWSGREREQERQRERDKDLEWER